MANAERLTTIDNRRPVDRRYYADVDIRWLVSRVRQLEGALRELMDAGQVEAGGRLLARTALDEDPERI